MGLTKPGHRNLIFPTTAPETRGADSLFLCHHACQIFEPFGACVAGQNVVDRNSFGGTSLASVRAIPLDRTQTV